MNDLNNQEGIESKTDDRPFKKTAQKAVKNKRKKIEQANDGYFCDAPSEKFDLHATLVLSVVENVLVLNFEEFCF